MKIEVEVNIKAPDLKFLAEALVNRCSMFRCPSVEFLPTKEGGMKAPDPEPEETTPDPEPTPAQESAKEEPEAEPSPYTKEDVRNALTTLGQTQGKEKAKAVLTAVGATKFSDLKESQYEAVITKIKELM